MKEALKPDMVISVSSMTSPGSLIPKDSVMTLTARTICPAKCDYDADDHRDQKKAPDPLKLELQTIVNPHVGSRESDSDPLEEQSVLLAAKPPLLSQQADAFNACFPVGSSVGGAVFGSYGTLG
ncbi:hypothetical protein STEG23_000117, partial [Scotinomys teguina]